MTERTRQRMTGPQRREQLLDVTKAIVAADGLGAVSIDGVARAAGISRPVVYDHFAGLEALLVAMLDREGQRALTQLGLDAPAPNTTPRAALQGALRVYLEAVAADPVTWRLVLLPPDGLPAGVRALVTDARAAFRARLADVARGLNSPDPELTARSLQALGEEAARLVLTAPDEHPVDRLMAHAAWLLERF